MNKSAPQPARVCRASTPATGSPVATKAARGARMSGRCLPATNQTTLSCRAKSRHLRLSRLKLASFHETDRFSQKQFAVRRCCFVARELNQIASIQEVLQQRFFLGGE